MRQSQPDEFGKGVERSRIVINEEESIRDERGRRHGYTPSFQSGGI
jgi:hypothetical protein